MRIAIVSDVHSNLAALEAVLQHADKQNALDAVWLLGDCVGYGPQPNEVIALLARQSMLGVIGNHDLAVIGAMDTSDFNPAAALAAAWNAGALSDESRQFLASLPAIATPTDAECVLCHGSLRAPAWEYLVSEEAARAQFEQMTVPWSFVGHTHIPLIIEQTEDGEVFGDHPENGTLVDLEGRRLILNPGGVGQPRDGDPRSPYAVLDTEQQTVQFWRVPYPIGKTQTLMETAGLPERLIERLAQGR